MNAKTTNIARYSNDAGSGHQAPDVGFSQEEPTKEEKIEEAIKRLPPDVQGEIEAMVRRDPRIANSLTNAGGQVDSITNAVRAGRQAASDPEGHPSNIQGVDPALHPVAEGAYNNAKQESVEPNPNDPHAQMVSGGEQANHIDKPDSTPPVAKALVAGIAMTSH